jgi:integrating conjugative element membrane protein (TIGR03747 family)
VQRPTQRPGLIAHTLGRLAQFLSILFLALCCSILLEWIGMVVWWPEQGASHSERMLAQELRYLNEGFERSLIPTEPSQLARDTAAGFNAVLARIGVYRFIAWAQSPDVPANAWQRGLHEVTSGLGVYLEAMTNTTQTFAMRLAVLAQAMPVFALFGLVGTAEGLMRRDLRRWGGGRESSFLYHHTKKLLAPSIALAWMLYLAMPFSIHPNWVILPFAILFAVGMAMTTATFKKYL